MSKLTSVREVRIDELSLSDPEVLEMARFDARIAGMKEALTIATDCMVGYELYPGSSKTVESVRTQIVLAIADAIEERWKSAGDPGKSANHG